MSDGPRSTLASGPWHAGETALQARAGSAVRLAAIGPRVLRDHLTDEHQAFYAQLPFVVAGLLDGSGAPRITLLAGRPGFAHADGEHRLRIAPAPAPADPARAGLRDGAPIAILGIEAHTRRRNRLNGWLEAAADGAWQVRVGQSFGNCPKSIHPRLASWVPEPSAPLRVTTLAQPDAAALALVARADTFFIASAHPAAATARDAACGLDVSHRGGPPGFVRVETPTHLVVPDLAGNGYFNTLGNLSLAPACALLFVDFATGERLEVLARAAIAWDAAPPEAPGAQRLLRFEVGAVTRLEGGLPLRWRELAVG